LLQHVTELLKKEGLKFKRVTMTAGDKAHYVDGYYRVPKRDLVSALEVTLQAGARKVAEDMELWPQLRQEMLSFRNKIKLNAAHDSYEYWREGEHEDLVLATALACWWIARRSRPGRKVRFLR
jgi:hypothetical protein